MKSIFLILLTVLLSIRVSAQELRPWVWGKSNCQNCPLVIEADAEPILQSEDVHLYLRSLENEKAKLMRIYKLSGQEYNLLAHMAVGILGRESGFFTSERYFLKETFPPIVRLLKVLKAAVKRSSGTVSPNSRGPTQIKIIPPLITKNYGFFENQLHYPSLAAIATMGFLIEALKELKRRVQVNDLDFVNASNYVDYLPYLYFGSAKTLIERRAQPEKNLYIREMKRFMGKFRIYEVIETQTL